MACIVERLPPEILRKIFFLAVLIVSGWHAPEQNLTPIRISHVCRAWRDVALSDGRLWSYFYLSPVALNGVPRPNHDFKPVFDTLIARSAASPLNLEIYWDFKRGRYSSDEIKSAIHIVTTLIKEHRRWGDVDFFLGWQYQFPSDTGPFHMSGMSKLISLRLHFKRQSHITIDLGQSSQLRFVKLYGNFSISASKEMLCHLKKPSKLAFRDDYKAEDVIRSCQNFLSLAPYLEELQLEFDNGLEVLSSPLDDDRPVFPGLRSLYLFPYQGPEVFVDNVTLPSLETLSFHCDNRIGGQRLLGFLERSLPPLTYLSIHEGCAHEDNLIPCLRLLPTLERLYVMSPPVSTRFFRELTVPENGGRNITCPKLEALAFIDIKCLENSDACLEALISMLESRAKIAKTFENVWYRPLDDNSTVHLSQLRRYKSKIKEGLFSGVAICRNIMRWPGPFGTIY